MRSLKIDLVIDVGANQGQFGLELRRGGYLGRIVSIEPLEAPFRRLSQSAAREEPWSVVRSAVGQHAGTATMHVAANGGASSSFLAMLDAHAESAPDAQYVADEPVDVATLDDLVEPHLGDAASVFTKIDVQGFELHVLAGADATLARSTMVQIEMSLVPLYEAAPAYRQILDCMEELGFFLVGVEPGFASGTGVLLQADGLFARAASTRSLQIGL